MGPLHCTLAFASIRREGRGSLCVHFSDGEGSFHTDQETQSWQSAKRQRGVNQSEACFSLSQEVSLVPGTVKMSFSDKAALMLVYLSWPLVGPVGKVE